MAEWPSETQKEAVEVIVSGESHIMIIMPTAGGKSICIRLLSLPDKGRMTLVIVPPVELVYDIIKCCKNHKVPAVNRSRAPQIC